MSCEIREDLLCNGLKVFLDACHHEIGGGADLLDIGDIRALFWEAQSQGHRVLGLAVDD